MSNEDRLGKLTSEDLIASYNLRRPKGWRSMNEPTRLDFIATRILAISRTTRSHTEMRREGVLSTSQMERRKRREVYSKFGSLDAIPIPRGQFSRKYRRSR